MIVSHFLNAHGAKKKKICITYTKTYTLKQNLPYDKISKNYHFLDILFKNQNSRIITGVFFRCKAMVL